MQSRQTQLASPQRDSRESQRNRQPATQQAVIPYSGNQTALRRLSRIAPRIQYRLEIGAVDDPLEAEADRVADHVMRMPDPAISVVPAAPQISRKCAACEEEDRKLQTKPSAAPAPSEAPPNVHDVLRSSGQSLDQATRASLEPRFGHDFSAVRIHTDPKAAESARSVAAHAYTLGNNIVFGASQYAPATESGRRLLAHELSHVVQQTGGSSAVARPRIQRAPDLSVRDKQLACVVRLGGCASSRDGGIPSPENIQTYNRQCRADSHYSDADITPTNEECLNPPKEPLTTGEAIALIALVAFLSIPVAVAGAAILAEGAAAVSIVIASLSDAAMTGAAYYLGNAIVVNEIGVFTAGVLMACEGDVAGLLRAIASGDPQALLILAEAYILHINIKIATGPARPATIPVKILPPDEQTDPTHIKIKTVGPPVFEDENQATNAPPQKGQTGPNTPSHAQEEETPSQKVPAAAKPIAAAGPAVLDPSITKYAKRPEQLTAKRLAEGFPEFNGRTFKGVPPPDPGYDWTDDLGRTYDAMGDGTTATNLNVSAFIKSLDRHLLKGNNFTVIDLTGYKPDQIAAITQYVNSLPPAKQSIIRRIGF